MGVRDKEFGAGLQRGAYRRKTLRRKEKHGRTHLNGKGSQTTLCHAARTRVRSRSAIQGRRQGREWKETIWVVKPNSDRIFENEASPLKCASVTRLLTFGGTCMAVHAIGKGGRWLMLTRIHTEGPPGARAPVKKNVPN